ncbi:MAG TPA: hypothetical protein VKR06_45215 [Ktedonosporobacter sp.]|nr:hypothetical protein [Ktedonosporobacter sp.]
MDLDINHLRALFEPFDMPHLLLLWAVLALLIFLWGLMLAICGGYPQARQFWKTHLAVLASTCALSGIAFLFFHLDPLLLILCLSTLAFIVQSELAKKSQEVTLEDWWLFRIHQRYLADQEEQASPIEIQQEQTQ